MTLILMIFFSQVPFLPIREEFGPKRNQARQKLASTSVNFEDLCGDIHFELARRYPESIQDVRYL
jgi:hypothetical protein